MNRALAGKKFEHEIYQDPPGGHSFNRINTKTAADSWQKIKAFLARHLKGQ
jgi:dienelactone hydrolase